MIPPVQDNLPAIRALCEEYGVARLDLVGSAARETDWDPERSDIDFLVRWGERLPTLWEGIDFRDRLGAIVGRSVDVIQHDAITAPWWRAVLDRDRWTLHGA